MSLKKKPIRRILVLLNWSTPEMMRGIVEYARQAGWWLDVPFVGWWGGTPPEAVLPSPENPFDGMLSLLFSMPEPLANIMQGLQVPTVSLSGIHSERASAILADNRAIGRLGAQAFLERGFRHVACIGGWGHPEVGARNSGFSQAASEGGASVISNTQEMSGLTDYVHRTQLAGQLAKLPKPLGIMAWSDRVATRIEWACQLAGLAVPEEVAIIGAGNDEMVCEQAPVPLSSVRRDDYRHGHEAARLLDDLMNGRPVPAEPLPIEPLGIVHRQSTEILAVPDVTVAKALRYIWQNSADPHLGVREVATFAGMSISSLNNGFKQHLGTPIGWQIRHKRLTHAMDLLKGGTMRVSDIAARCGYRDAEHLRSTLRIQTGLSPRAWRKKNR